MSYKPPVEIDLDDLKKLAERLWSHAEIAAHYGVSKDTITRKYASIIEECRQKGYARLIDLQWKAAISGDTKMLIYMSKVHRKETEKIVHEIIGVGGLSQQEKEYEELVKTQWERKELWSGNPSDITKQ